MTLVEYFASTNTDAIDRFTNSLYLEGITAYGDAENEVGAQIAATWYHRNMIITQNIARVIDSPEDRVLVIIGAAHRAVIKDFVGDRQDMEYVEIGSFLR